METDSEKEEEEKNFPILLAEANFRKTSKRVWQLTVSDHTVAFIGTGNSPLNYSVRISGFDDKDIDDLWRQMLSIEKLLVWVQVNSHKEETPGFTQEIEVDSNKQSIETTVMPTNDRQLTILTWGVAKMAHTPSVSQRNWFVGVITTRKYGVNLKKNNGKSEEIQAGIMADPKFPNILNSIVSEVEKNNYTVISISCTKGRHRSVAMAEILKKHIYPQAQVRHLTL